MEKIYSDLVLFLNNYSNISLLGYWGFNFSPLLEKIYLFYLLKVQKLQLVTPHLHILTPHHIQTHNHYHFILKQKKSKDKTHPITKFQISSNKNINKNIKPNNNTIIKNLTIQIYQQYILNISIIIISYSSKKKKKKQKTNIKPNNKSHEDVQMYLNNKYIPMIQIYLNN